MYFPTDKITGLPRRRFYAEPKDWDKITDSWTYEDRTPDFNEVSDTAPRRWEYGFTLVSKTNTDPIAAQQFDDFYDAARKTKPFYFTDKKGVTHFPVYIESYSRTHETTHPDVVFIDFKLVGYKSQVVSITNPTVSLSSVGIGDGNAEISGTVSASYDLRLFVNDAFYSITNDGGSFTLPVALSDLSSGSNYFYVIAANSTGGYAVSNVLTFSLIPSALVPQNLEADASLFSQVDLAWDAPTGFPSIASYQIRRATDSGFTLNVADINVGNVTSYSDTSVVENTTYYYKVRAKNASNAFSGYSDVVSETTPSAPVPINYALTANGATVTSSSVYSSTYPLSSINNGLRHTDGNWETGHSVWRSANKTSQYIKFDLGTARTIRKVSLSFLTNEVNYSVSPNPVTSGATFGISDYTVSYSSDDVSYTTWITVTGNTLALREHAPTAATARYFKFTPTASSFTEFVVVEIELWDTVKTENVADIIVCEGDSRTYGAGASAWPAYLEQEIDGCKVYNVATSGDKILTDISGQYMTEVIPKYDPAPWRRNILILWAGTNDFGSTSATGADVYAGLADYCDDVRAAGWDGEVWVSTEIHRLDSFGSIANPKIDAFNALLIGDSSFADKLVRLDLQPELSDPNDTTYYQSDKLHLTDAAYIVLNNHILSLM